MATAAVTYSFSPNTTILSAQANTNFNDLVDFLNNSVVHVDASKAFTNVPSGPASNPSTDNQLARKKYVDDEIEDAIEGVSQLIHYSSYSSNTSGLGSASTTLLEVTHTFVSGHRYEFQASGSLTISGTGYYVYIYRSGSPILRLAQNNEATGDHIFSGFDMHTALSGSQTVQLRVGTVSGSMTVNGSTRSTKLVIIDHGPA